MAVFAKLNVAHCGNIRTKNIHIYNLISTHSYIVMKLLETTLNLSVYFTLESHIFYISVV